jgi:hypothetical protein
LKRIFLPVEFVERRSKQKGEKKGKKEKGAGDAKKRKMIAAAAEMDTSSVNDSDDSADFVQIKR